MKRRYKIRPSKRSKCSQSKGKRVAAVIVLALATLALVFALTGCSAIGSAMDAANTTTGDSHPNTKAIRANDLVTGAPASAKTATVLVYLNGSDLESEAGEASIDISEMLKSKIGKNVNVLIETIGTKKWQDHGIASDHTQRYRVNQGSLELVDNSLDQLDTTSPDTLADFIKWGTENYPADRYMLIMWDHGAGPVYGFGYDEFQGDYAALTLDEIQTALEANPSVHFDMIGMDCCIMSSLETYLVLSPFCDYAVLSEDFEPGVGWSYSNWMAKLENNPAISTVELGTTIVDDMVNTVAADPENGDATLALVDESAIKQLYNAWTDFAYENKDALLNTNYSQEVSQHGRDGFESTSRRPSHHGNSYSPDGSAQGFESTSGSHGHGSHVNAYGFGNNSGNGYDSGYGYGSDAESDANGTAWSSPYEGWGLGHSLDDYGLESHGGGMNGWTGLFDYWDNDMSYVTMSDYFVTDIMAVASSVGGEKAEALEAALNNAIVHYKCTAGEEGMTGIGVTLPYGDAEFYEELDRVFTACGIDKNYIEWLEDFVDAQGANDYYDYGGFYEDWQGWETYSGNAHGHPGWDAYSNDSVDAQGWRDSDSPYSYYSPQEREGYWSENGNIGWVDDQSQDGWYSGNSSARPYDSAYGNSWNNYSHNNRYASL